MLDSNQRLNVMQEGAATVVELIDRKILDEVAILEIGEQLGALVSASEIPRIVLDFTNVAHMSSSALGMLITLHKRIREKDGQLRLCSIQPAISEIFEITRLSEIFQIAASREAALSGLS
jgi:anti-anti-sigma factor